VKKIDQDQNLLTSDLISDKELEINKIKTTNVNILLNRVRQDKRKQFKKKVLFIGLVFLIISLASLINFI
tara:strand:- start:216 stop:425 length:210 start_codon:yes stop_codon:yes gene_type:complete